MNRLCNRISLTTQLTINQEMTKKKTKNSHSVTPEESSLFRETVGQITPIHHDRVSHPKKRTRSHHRQQQPDHHKYSTEMSTQADANLIETLPKSLRRKLRHGSIPIEGRLDLHGQTQHQAEDALKTFLQQACYMNIRCVLIIHGKGYNSTDNIPILKELTHYILNQHSSVLDYCSATAKHGGHGATYALLNHNQYGDQ